MPHELKDIAKHVTSVIVDWQLNGTDLQEHQESRCLHLVCQHTAVERMRQVGFQEIIPPLVELAMLKCVFTGVVTAAVGQLTFVSGTVVRFTFTS